MDTFGHKKYKAIFEQGTAGIAEIDSYSGQFIHINNKYCNIVGYTEMEMKKISFQDITHPNDLKKDLKKMKHLREGKIREFSIEKRYFHKNGSIVWVLLTVIPLWEKGETPSFHIAVVEDITERKKFEFSLKESEERFRAISESQFEGIVIHDMGTIIDVNFAATNIFGYSRNELIDNHIKILVPEESYQIVKKNVETHMEGAYQIEGLHKSGRVFPLEVHSKEMPYLGKFVRVAAVRDITSQKQAQKKLEESEERYRTLVENTNDWIVEVDRRGRYVYTNPQVENVLGYKPHEIIGKSFMDLMNEKEAKRVYNLFMETIKDFGSFARVENICIHKHGHEVTIETNGTPFFDKDGKLLGYRGVNRDITERIKSEKMLDYLAYHDYLTGLPNRMLYNSRLRECIQSGLQENKKMAVMFLDLDDFKNINDTLGHQVGDILLQDISQKLILQFDKDIFIARLGGDEFILYIKNVHALESVFDVAHQILDLFIEPFCINELELFVTVSIGISLFPQDGTDVHTLVKNADLAMYQAKKMGKNQIKLYEKEMSTQIQERMDLESLLRYSIEKDELEIVYQAQVNIQTKKMIGMEALLRWNSSKLGAIPPSKFIPIAEETGFILNIGEWLIRNVCKQINDWKASDYLVPKISINISVKQIEQTNLLKIIKQILRETGVSPNLLELEITESVIMSQTEKNIATLDGLRNLGISLSVDDFGTGYSSLKYLKRLPIQKLKIDQSFVQDITINKNNESIIRGIIALANSLDLEIIAEGVETKEQIDFLINENCFLAQGYYFSFPLKPKDFLLPIQNEDSIVWTERKNG